MNEPRVGIALAAYKPNMDYFVGQLESIVSQDYSNWFCVIGVDSDLSELRSEQRLQKYFGDPRFEWHQNPRQLGATKNFESAMQLCLRHQPKLISCSDHDDIWLPHKISRSVALMKSLPPLSIVHCDMHLLIKKQGSEEFEVHSQTAWQLEKRGVHNVSSLDLMVRNVIAGAGMLIDAELARKFPMIPSNAFEHDHWYPLVASFFGGVHAIREPLYYYRIHGNNLSGISAYQGFFTPSANVKKLGIVRKLLMSANGSAVRCRAAVAANLPVSGRDRVTTEKPWDLGFGYFVEAFKHVADDPALARAFTARGIGKVLKLGNPRFEGFNNR